MRPIDYRLVCITHGDGAPLRDTLSSFSEMVEPKPTSNVVVWDGPTVNPEAASNGPGFVLASDSPQGFCRTTQVAWAAALDELPDSTEFIFWLEHDFRFLKPVDLTDLGRTLRQTMGVAQMSLLRGPEPHEGDTLVDPHWLSKKVGEREWFEQHAYWTTNPSLIPRAIFNYPWPTEPHCEGLFTHQLLSDGQRFGVWGNGEPWIKHVGVRSGFGY